MNLSYTSPILETSATALCGTTGMIRSFNFNCMFQCIIDANVYVHLDNSCPFKIKRKATMIGTLKSLKSVFPSWVDILELQNLNLFQQSKKQAVFG